MKPLQQEKSSSTRFWKRLMRRKRAFDERTRHARESLYDLDNPNECQWPRLSHEQMNRTNAMAR